MIINEPKTFGGGWSDRKLDALRNYLQRYTTALKNTPFKLVYIDAFAGAGVHKLPTIEPSLLKLDEESILEDEDNYRHGSPLIALTNSPPFDEFVFIEQDSVSIAQLKAQVAAHPASKDRNLRFLQGDANEELLELTKEDWRSRRAVAFLDPFALQVRWDTIEKIAETQAIDMWLLFPAMAVNRMMPKSGKVPEKWAEKLNLLFGETGWKETFYSQSEQTTLFGDAEINKVPKVFETLSSYVTCRLESVFEKANQSPLILKNKSGTPIFLLCFASGNPKGAPIATRIAQHIINTSSYG